MLALPWQGKHNRLMTKRSSLASKLILLVVLGAMVYRYAFVPPTVAQVVYDCDTDSDCAAKYGGNGDPEPMEGK